MTKVWGTGSRRTAALRVSVGCCALLLGCEERQLSDATYYDETIAPILDVGCQRQTTGCHVDDGRGFALGNLDLSSYDALMRRRDVLEPYGPYPVGVLLLKGGNPATVDVRTIDPPDPNQPDRLRLTIVTDVRHAAGEGAISQGSLNYSALKRWIDAGHTRSGVPQRVLSHSLGPCSHAIQTRPYLDTSGEPSDRQSFNRFVNEVQPVLKERCAGGRCHGSPIADLYLTCGENDAERRWNYELALRYIDIQAATSELLRRPLVDSAGGVYHEGGDVFADIEDAGYRAIRGWAEQTVQDSPELLEFGAADAGLRFFANRVEPVLVRKGCLFLNCHSPAMFHDLRLRGGAGGQFSSVAIHKNYELARSFLALDSADPNQSRLIAKNLCPPGSAGQGIQHRGGALFEDFGGCADAADQATPAKCAGVDADGGDLNDPDVKAYCVLARWHAIEREQAIARGELPSSATPAGVVFVARPEAVGGSAEFDTFRPGAELMLAAVSSDAAGRISLGAARSLSNGCGLGSGADVRGPALSWDGQHIAFAARSAAGEPLRIYQMRSDGSQCAPLAAIAPDGRIVFASTRGKAGRGPSRTPAALTPNADLWVFDPKADPALRQLTFLSNQELAPSFMSDGRVIFSAEKRALDFHQFALRRQNLDGGDYHPLIAQRSSIGFESATEVIELANRNFAMVVANLDAVDGGGQIAIVNRSIGPDQADRDPADRAYVHALGTLAGQGVFRSPAALPSGRILASCDLSGSDPAQGPHHYALCELDPSGAAPRVLWSDPARVAIEAIPLWTREPRAVFVSRSDEVNGSSRLAGGDDTAVVHYTDMPLLATLLFSNTRIGRPILAGVNGIELFESKPAPSSAQSFAGLGANLVSDQFGQFYQELRSLGRAPLAADGSVRVRLPGGMPISIALLDADEKPLSFGARDPFTGPMRQREEMQYYPGEQLQQSMPRQLFNGVCAGCHGSISGRELDAVVDVDVLTSASQTLADDDPIVLR